MDATGARHRYNNSTYIEAFKQERATWCLSAAGRSRTGAGCFTGEQYGSFERGEQKPDRSRVLGSQSGRGRRGRGPSERLSSAGAARAGREGISDPPEHIKAAGILLLRG